MRHAFLVSLILIAGCGGGSPSDPPDPGAVCPDQVYADLNSRCGRLADVLYQIDIAPLLLLKGASDRFTTTVADHDSLYTKQEMYDVITSVELFREYADSARTLMTGIEGAADSLDEGSGWADLVTAWRSAMDEELAAGDTLFGRMKEFAAGILIELAADESLGATVAVTCRARELAPDLGGLSAFIAGADDDEWTALFPTLLACASPYLSSGWGTFVRSLVAAFGEEDVSMLGSVGISTLDEIPNAEPGWPVIDAWATGSGAVTIDLSGTGLAGPALAVLIGPSGASPGVCFYPFYQKTPTTIGPLRPGSYDALVLSSGARPAKIASISVNAGSIATAAADPLPLADDGCTLSGGDVALWVIDPTIDEHLANDYDLDCRTEVWTGRTIYQTQVSGLTGVLLRSETTFRFDVDCGDRSIDEVGEGTVVIRYLEGADCSAGDPVPGTFTFRLSGARTLDGISLVFDPDPWAYSILVDCPGIDPATLDVTSQVFPSRQVELPIGTTRHAESTFPPGATQDSPFYIFTEVDRLF